MAPEYYKKNFNAIENVEKEKYKTLMIDARGAINEVLILNYKPTFEEMVSWWWICSWKSWYNKRKQGTYSWFHQKKTNFVPEIYPQIEEEKIEMDKTSPFPLNLNDIIMIENDWCRQSKTRRGGKRNNN